MTMIELPNHALHFAIALWLPPRPSRTGFVILHR